jgi:hypothetical protein
MKLKNNLWWHILLVSVVFQLLFWKEQLGLNTLIFTLLIALTQVFNRPAVLQSWSWRITLGGTLLAATMVVYLHSGTSQFAWIASFALLSGFYAEPGLYFAPFGFFNWITHFFKTPYFLLAASPKWKKDVPEVKIRSNRHIWILPISFLFLFMALYLAGNSILSKWSIYILESIGDFLSTLLDYFFSLISFSRIFFTVLSLLVAGSLLMWQKDQFYTRLQEKYPHFLVRKRQKQPEMQKGLHRGIDHFYLSAVYSMVLLNVLIFIVNGLDISVVWLNPASLGVTEMKSFVHEGTYMLIFSIFMAMGVILYFFQGNLHYYKDRKGLLYPAVYAWLLQNAFLTLSVAVRNYHYINQYGLAYKRIGVISFLILTIFGLFTVYLKVARKRSVFHLLHLNSWAVYGMMLLLSVFNWDVLITRYNLTHPQKAPVDLSFLYNTVSDKNLLILKDYKDDPALGNDRWYRNKVELFERRLQRYPGWLSWNYADYLTKRGLWVEPTR